LTNKEEVFTSSFLLFKNVGIQTRILESEKIQLLILSEGIPAEGSAACVTQPGKRT